MLFALGAASSAIDALKALMSSKSSSTQPGGPGQGATGPFDFSAATSAPTSAATNAGFGGGVGPQISPDTMSALLAAQGQSTDAGSSAPTSRADALKDLFSQDRRRRRRQDHQIGIRKSARRRRHQPRAGRRCIRKARQGRRRLGQSRRDGIGAEGQRPSPSSPMASDDASGSGGSSSDPLLQALERCFRAPPSPTATVRPRRR